MKFCSKIVYMKFLEKKIKIYQYSHPMNIPQYVGPNENYKWWMFFNLDNMEATHFVIVPIQIEQVFYSINF
jgi:hypothetical protein